jgi:hypothetical protein
MTARDVLGIAYADGELAMGGSHSQVEAGRFVGLPQFHVRPPAPPRAVAFRLRSPSRRWIVAARCSDSNASASWPGARCIRAYSTSQCASQTGLAPSSAIVSARSIAVPRLVDACEHLGGGCQHLAYALGGDVALRVDRAATHHGPFRPAPTEHSVNYPEDTLDERSSIHQSHKAGVAVLRAGP